MALSTSVLISGILIASRGTGIITRKALFLLLFLVLLAL